MCKGVDLKELFPSKWSALVFFMYIALFINQGLLVTASQDSNNAYNYNTIIAVLLTEVVKLGVCCILYSINSPFCLIFQETKKHLNVLWLYFVPAILYCFYNNLTYINLSTFDPTTYFILLQFRVVVTGIIFQIIFKKRLSIKQWCSLIILTIGCILKQIHFSDDRLEKRDLIGKKMSFSFSLNGIFILAQILCSCFAGVYNEHLLKHYGMDVNIFIQNIFMYVDSIICNLAVLIWCGNLGLLFTLESLAPFFTFKVMLVVVNNAAIGIVTSFFLRSLNSILKTFASALELVFTAILSQILFSIPIHLNTMLAIVTIIAATILYTHNPVSNTKAIEQSEKPLLNV